MDAALLQRIDLLRLAMHLGGNARMLQEMLALFEHTSHQLLSEMEAASTTQDIARWRDKIGRAHV